MLKPLQDFLLSRSHGIPRSELLFARQLAAQPFFSQCDAVLDIGANRGMFSAALALATKGVPFHAFEPLPTLHAELSDRIGRIPGIELHKCGLGAASGTADLHHGTFHEASSLLPMQKRHQELFPGSRPTTKTSVSIITLDEFFAARPTLRQAFIKLDVQGYELEVMKGCQASHHRIRAALVEVSFEDLYENGASAEEVVAYFIGQGFLFTGFVRPLFSNRKVFPISGDCLFVRADTT